MAFAPPRRLNSEAQEAFRQHNVELSIAAHNAKAPSAEAHTTSTGQYTKNIVFGGLDGIITTFAVVAGVYGADLSPDVVLVMGFANLVADGISMGFGDYLSSVAEREYTLAERQREEWEMDNNPAGEVQEMVEIYKLNGYSEEDATAAINILVKNRKFFVDHMMVHELGLMPVDPEESPARDGVVMFLSFCIFGFVPLISYVGFIGKSNAADEAFIVACVLTAITLFSLGLVKGKLTNQPYVISGFWGLLNGTLAAITAFFIGWALGQLTDVKASCAA